jgi:hypothetical protein
MPIGSIAMSYHHMADLAPGVTPESIICGKEALFMVATHAPG